MMPSVKHQRRLTVCFNCWWRARHIERQHFSATNQVVVHTTGKQKHRKPQNMANSDHFEAARSPQRNWYGTVKAPRYGPTKLKSGLQCVAGFSRRGRGKSRSHFECKHQHRTVENLFLIPESRTRNPVRRRKQEKTAMLAIIRTYK